MGLIFQFGICEYTHLSYIILIPISKSSISETFKHAIMSSGSITKSIWWFALYRALKWAVILFSINFSLRGQTVHFVHCKRIPQQGRSLCSSFVLSFSLIVPTIFLHFKDLSLNMLQCTVWSRNVFLTNKKRLIGYFWMHQHGFFVKNDHEKRFGNSYYRINTWTIITNSHLDKRNSPKSGETF